MKYFVSPLKPGVAEHERPDEVKEDDKVILMGKYMVVVEPLDGDAQGYGQNSYSHVQAQPSPRRVPVQAQNGFRRPVPVQEIGIDHAQAQPRTQAQGREGFNQTHGQGQNGFRHLSPVYELNGFVQGQDQGQRQGQDGFAYAQRQGGGGNAQGQHRFGNGHGHGHGQGGDRNILPMATEGMVNWLKITGVEQQVASRRGMNRRRETLLLRSAIR
jgi:hypothetical protein